MTAWASTLTHGLGFCLSELSVSWDYGQPAEASCTESTAIFQSAERNGKKSWLQTRDRSRNDGGSKHDSSEKRLVGERHGHDQEFIRGGEVVGTISHHSK